MYNCGDIIVLSFAMYSLCLFFHQAPFPFFLLFKGARVDLGVAAHGFVAGLVANN